MQKAGRSYLIDEIYYNARVPISELLTHLIATEMKLYSNEFPLQNPKFRILKVLNIISTQQNTKLSKR